MQNLLNDLTRLLEQDNRLVAEGKLLKNKVVELALALDPDLIKLLLKHEAIKKHFFVDVEGHQAEPALAAALADFTTRAGFIKILGSYPVAH